MGWVTNTAASYRSSFLLIQLSGRISVGRAGCGVDLAGCVSVAGFLLWPQGASPRLLPPSGRLGWSPGAWGAPNKGNADGAVGILGKCRAREGYGPAPGPTRKRPCATLSRSVERGTNTAASYRSSFLLIQLSGLTSAGRAGCGADLAECVSIAGFFLRPQGAFPPGYYPLWVLGWSPSAWGVPNKGNAEGAVGIFGKCRARMGYGPAPGPTKKRPCATLSRSVGRGPNTAASYRNSALETGDRTRSPYLLP